MSDGGLRQHFRDYLRAGFHWQSIETVLVSSGVPDSNYCSAGREGWVEFKFTDGWAVTLRTEQTGWLTARALRGGRVTVAVRRTAPPGPRRAAADQLWLCEGGEARALKKRGLRGGVGILGVWDGGPARWDWDAVRALLLR